MANHFQQQEDDGSGALHRSRLYWQCRRGMLELDLLLQSFLDHEYDEIDTGERRAFAALLSYPDALLLEYVMGRMIPADPQLVVARLRTTAQA